MLRRHFLRNLFCSATVAGVAPHLAQAAPKKRLLIQKTVINGMAYYQAKSAIEQLSYDDPVQLKREPGNPYDSKAIEVYWAQYKLGYIPRINNFALAKLLDQGETISACIAEIDPQRLPYGGLEIEITWEG